MKPEQTEQLTGLLQREYGNIAGILVQKNGSVLYEKYFNDITAGNALHVYSVTKSVFSTLIGIAIDKGYLRSVDQKVLEFFPGYAVPQGETVLQTVTLRHLLTMTAPYKCETEPYAAFFASENWVQFALGLLGGTKQPGDFCYSPIVGSHLLSGILAQATGQPILQFANEVLFEPLGIRVPQSIFLHSEEEHFAVMNDKNTTGWVADPEGLNAASWGLFLTVRDMAKFGQLYLNGGQWGSKQLVPKSWVAESTTVHSHWGALNYGYLWWVTGKGSFAALGDGGNAIYVNAENGMVVAIASLFAPEVKDRVALIQEVIEPLFRAAD